MTESNTNQASDKDTAIATTGSIKASGLCALLCRVAAVRGELVLPGCALLGGRVLAVSPSC